MKKVHTILDKIWYLPHIFSFFLFVILLQQVHNGDGGDHDGETYILLVQMI